MNISVNRLYCTGCGECAAVCPANIITLHDLHASIDPDMADNCIDCQRCRTACPAVTEKSKGYRFVHLEYCRNCIGNCLYNRVECRNRRSRSRPSTDGGLNGA